MYFYKEGIPFVRYLIFLCFGILTAFLWRDFFEFIPILLAYAGLLGVVVFRNKLKLFRRLGEFSLPIFLFFVGSALVFQKNELNRLNHFSCFLEDSHAYKLKIIDNPEIKNGNMKFTIEIICLKKEADWVVSSGKGIAYFRAYEGFRLKQGDLLLTSSMPRKIEKPKNPDQFDYAAFMENRGIYGVFYLNNQNTLIVGNEKPFLIKEFAYKIHSLCKNNLNLVVKNKDALTVAQALLLGDKAEMEDSLNEAYSASGTIHALAVSGLHVSMIYFMIQLVFGFLKKSRTKLGELFFALVALFILWLYAMVTGLSPSVVRAVTMFSLYVVAAFFKRNTGGINILAFAAFAILCINPSWLKEIGFQFSFLAVLGIVWFYPVLKSMYLPQHSWGEKIVSLSYVSLSAQLAVAPLSIYYFHSFPLLFLFFNLLVIPLATIALYSGVAGLVFTAIPAISILLLKITEWCIIGMNYLVKLSLGNKYFNSNMLYLDEWMVLGVYLGLFLLFYSWKHKVYAGFKFSILLFLIVLGMLSVRSMDIYFPELLKNNPNFIVTEYEVKNHNIFSVVKKGRALVFSDSLLSEKDKIIKHNVLGHLIRLGVKNIEFREISKPLELQGCGFQGGEVLVWQGVKILILNSTECWKEYEVLKGKVDRVVVRKQPL